MLCALRPESPGRSSCDLRVRQGPSTPARTPWSSPSATAASADYYIHAQASHRPAEEYYLSGEESDEAWWNPAGLFGESRAGIGDGRTVDSANFHRLYNRFQPATGEKRTRNAGSLKRCPGYDLIFNADKTVSALWAVAPPELRAQLEQAHDDAIRAALEDDAPPPAPRRRAQDRQAARSRGLHPYQTEEAPRLIESARELLRLQAIPAARARILRDTVAAYDEWLTSRHASAPRTGNRTDAPPTRQAREPRGPAHGAHRLRTGSPRRPFGQTPTVQTARSRTARPTPLKRRHAIPCRRPGEARSRPIRRAPVPEPAPAPKPPPREFTPDELFENHRRRCDANREAARAQGIEPYETGGWRSIHEAARYLVNRDDAPDAARPYIREVISGYYRWETRQRPRHDPRPNPTPSGIEPAGGPGTIVTPSWPPGSATFRRAASLAENS